MRAPIALALGLLWLSLLARSAHAYPAQVTAATPLILRVNGKPVNGPVIPKGRQIEVLATSPSGGFVQTDFAGKRGWVNAKATRALGGGGRHVASSGESHASAGGGGDFASVAATLGLQGSGIGIGFGVQGLFNTPWSNGQWRFEAGPAFQYFPSAGYDTFTSGYSITVYNIEGVVRGMYTLNATMEVGGEVGLVYEKASFPNSIGGFTVTTSAETADSWLGFMMGGAYTWRFAHDWRLLGGLRFLVANGGTYLLNAGIEYRF